MRISSPGRMGLAATRRRVRSFRFDSISALGVDERLQRETSPKAMARRPPGQAKV